MVKNEIKPWPWLLALLLVAVSCDCGSRSGWKAVPMDGHRSGVVSLTSDNMYTGLGSFTDSTFVLPSGATYAPDSPVAEVARVVMSVQPHMAAMKEVIGHSARMMTNERTDPDLPLGNLFVDVLRAYGTRYFGVEMDFALTNFGGIRVPMPEGAITLEDISSMFPFKNYLCYCKIKGENLQKLFEQMVTSHSFQATSGSVVKIKGGKLESVLVGGEPIDPNRIYNVTTIDFLLDGGDGLRVGALADDLVLSDVLLKDIMLDYVRTCEANGVLVDAKSDGRVIVEE